MLMRHPPPSLQFLASAATDATAAMSSRPHYRGGRNQWPRPSSSSNRYFSGGRDQYVTGDSNFRSVGDANLGFQPGDAVGTFPPNQPGFRPPPRNFNQNQHFRRPPPFDPNPPYPPNQPRPQQYRPRQKPLDAGSFPHHQTGFRPAPRNFNQNQHLSRDLPFDPNRFGWPPQPYQPRPRQKPLDYRKWEYAKTTPSPTYEKFTVLSYNILADSLANEHRSKLYYHIPHHMMDWQWRKRNFVFELGLWSADIMCFQEVDRFQDLEEELKLKGYSGIWKMRTGNPVDGCAIFWRSSRFKMIHEECIEFNKLGLRDNVAQICVLESMCQNCTKVAGQPTSSTGCNKVVICNIHVLYNPKRGEIKLGQVRMLLDRAHALSKTWNDVPIVFCGDFNCTPKSPLYNFISEQQLDLSGVDRDKVSGQASAQIYAPRSYNPNHGALPANHFVQGPPVVGGREAVIKPTDSLLEMQETNNPDSTLENVLLANNWSQPQFTNTLNVFDKSSTNVHCQKDDSAQDVEAKKETKHNSIDVSVVETVSDFHLPGDGLKEDSYGKGGFPGDIFSNESRGCSPPVASPVEQSYSDVTRLGFKEKDDFTFNSNPGLSSGHQDSNVCVGKEGMDFDINKCLSTRDTGSVREGIDPDYVDPVNSESPSSKFSGQVSIVDTEVPSAPCEVNISIASTTTDLELQKNLEHLSLAELDELNPEDGNTAEDDNAFLSALHSTEDAFSSDLASAPSNSALSASDNVVEDGLSPRLDSEFFSVERTYYDRSLWTPMEIETATGNAECTLLQHPLKLRSTYTEVEDCSGARDSNGEPQATSYNRLFLGTVDYIWRSEGLQTVRVLAPIPKNAMQWTSGFPTKKWGSDHIALASELAFINSSDQES